MRSYLIDEISLPDLEKMAEYLKLNSIQSGLGKIFWVPFPQHLLSQIQAKHFLCQPHVFAAELGANWIKLEFFVRTLKGLRCDCQAYCTAEQEQFILNWSEQIIQHLHIKT